MPIIVALEGQAIQMHKATPVKAASTDAFAQVMQALISPQEAVVTVETVTPPVDVSDEEIQPEEVQEDEILSLEAAIPAINVPVQTAVVTVREAVAKMDGPEVKPRISTPLPLAFVAQGWQSESPEPQLLKPVAAQPLEGVTPPAAVNARTAVEVAAPLKTSDALPENDLPNVAIPVREARRFIETPTANPIQNAPVIIQKITTGLAPETLRQVSAAPVQMTREAIKEFEISVPSETPRNQPLQSEVRTAQVNVSPSLPMVAKDGASLADPKLQVDTPLFELGEIENAPFGVVDKATSTPIALTDAKPVTQAQVATAVAQQLAVAVQKNPDGVTELVLNPEELGRVKLSMATHDGALTMTITTERPETQDLMKRHIETLAQELRDLGFDDVGFSFQRQGQEGQNEDLPKHDVNIDSVETDSQIPAAQSTQTSGLDLRL